MRFDVLLLIVCAVGLAGASKCTDTCDVRSAQAVPRGRPVMICGTDGLTHSFNWTKWAGTDPCYPKCGVAMLHAGRCGCPNDCMKHMSYGICGPHPNNTKLFTCTCKPGWDGPDCSQIKCPNMCNGNGICISGNAGTNGAETGDYCECNPTHTGYDCSTAKNGLLPAPYGNVFDDGDPYHDDPYGDNHPIFDLQSLFTIRLTISKEDWAFMLAPVNTYTTTYVKAQMSFDNGAIRQVVNDVGLRTMGSWSRFDMKKSYEIGFNKFIPDQRFFGLKLMGFKGAGASGDTLVKAQLAMELARAAVLPSQRSSYGVIWLNDIFMGLFWGVENLDDQYLASRFGTSSGNLYKLNLVSMKYEGPYPSYYTKTLAKTPIGLNVTRFTQLTGTGEYSDLPEFLRFLSYGDDLDPAFQQQLAQRVNVRHLIRWCIIESFVQDLDGFAQGNNYALFHNTNPDTVPPTNQWELIRVDFDNINIITNIDALDFFVRKYTFNPLIKHAFTQYSQMYLDMYGQFLAYTFGAQSPRPPPEESVAVNRFRALRTFLMGWYMRDYAWQTSNGCFSYDFTNAALATIGNLPIRFNNAQAQVSIYIPPQTGTAHDGGEILLSSSAQVAPQTGINKPPVPTGGKRSTAPPGVHHGPSSSSTGGGGPRDPDVDGEVDTEVIDDNDMGHGRKGGIFIALLVGVGALCMMLDSCGLFPKRYIIRTFNRLTGRKDSDDDFDETRTRLHGDDEENEENFRSLESRAEGHPEKSDYIMSSDDDMGNTTEDERRYANRNNDAYRSKSKPNSSSSTSGKAPSRPFSSAGAAAASSSSSSSARDRHTDAPVRGGSGSGDRDRDRERFDDEAEAGAESDRERRNSGDRRRRDSRDDATDNERDRNHNRTDDDRDHGDREHDRDSRRGSTDSRGGGDRSPRSRGARTDDERGRTDDERGRTDDERDRGGRTDDERGRTDDERGRTDDERRRGRTDDERDRGGRTDDERSRGGRTDDERDRGGRTDDERSRGGRTDDERRGGRTDDERDRGGRTDDERDRGGRTDDERDRDRSPRQSDDERQD